ncbi:hypothetical protein [Marinilactibacillus psychrotolerans]|uniref:hypothetical protein n=1 Tax=Marinilactibacillus psychrotolerans TaxID=191770 RepID=UPI001D0322B0|nr:hypothetical protein [Marinilactibacillus psychrotolerans]
MEGVIYNEATGEKVEDIYINNFQLNENSIDFGIDGKESFELSAEFTENVALENNSVKLYEGSNNNYTYKFMVTDNFVVGSVKLSETSLLEKFEPNYKEFAVAINLDNEINFNYDTYLNSLKIDSSEIIESNNQALETLENESESPVLGQESSLMQSRASAYSYGTVRARSGATLAEATVRYTYVGANRYNINQIRYIATKSALQSSFVSIWSSRTAKSPLWTSKTNNKTVTSKISVTVPSSGGAVVAQVSKGGFVKIYGVPIPYVIQDYDFFYF